MFDNLSRHTLIRLTDGGVFLIKCKVMEYHGGHYVPCYLGHLFTTEVDYYSTRCYTEQIDSIIKEI
jgi:hypothetical protein